MFVPFLLLAFLGLQLPQGLDGFCERYIDLILVIDSSESVDFTGELDWLSDLISKLHVDWDLSFVVGVVMFSRYGENLLNLSMSNSEIVRAIESAPHRGKESYLDRAFDLIDNENLFSTHNSREEARHVVFAVTSDITTNPCRTSLSAKRLRDQGVFIQTIPFGDDPGASDIAKCINTRKGEDSTNITAFDLCEALNGTWYTR